MENNNEAIWRGKDRFLQIKDWLDKFDCQSVLEIGIGGGDISRYLSKQMQKTFLLDKKVLMSLFVEQLLSIWSKGLRSNC